MVKLESDFIHIALLQQHNREITALLLFRTSKIVFINKTNSSWQFYRWLQCLIQFANYTWQAAAQSSKTNIVLVCETMSSTVTNRELTIILWSETMTSTHDEHQRRTTTIRTPKQLRDKWKITNYNKMTMAWFHGRSWISDPIWLRLGPITEFFYILWLVKSKIKLRFEIQLRLWNWQKLLCTSDVHVIQSICSV